MILVSTLVLVREDDSLLALPVMKILQQWNVKTWMLRTIAKTLQKAWATTLSILLLKALFHPHWLNFQGGFGVLFVCLGLFCFWISCQKDSCLPPWIVLYNSIEGAKAFWLLEVTGWGGNLYCNLILNLEGTVRGCKQDQVFHNAAYLLETLKCTVWLAQWPRGKCCALPNRRYRFVS